MMTPAKPGQMSAHQARIVELEKQKELAEETMARSSSSFAAERQSQRVTVKDVARALPIGAAMVEFMKYRPFKFDARGGEQQWDDWSYVALVLRSGERPDSPNVALVPLGSADKVEAAIKNWRKMFDLEIHGRPAGFSACEAAAKDLAALIWKPIIPALGDCRKVYLSPDGELAFVNFGALPGRQSGRFAVEDFDISYVTTGRDLIRVGQGQSSPPLLVGSPDYGARLSSREAGPLALPGTLDEVKAIASVLAQRGEHPTLLTGAQATEAAVKAAKHPRILHLATHGFFMPDIAWEHSNARNDRYSHGESGFDLAGNERFWRQIKKENPMRRSGIALAHVNDTLAGRREPGENDGILTAEEVVGMDPVGHAIGGHLGVPVRSWRIARWRGGVRPAPCIHIGRRAESGDDALVSVRQADERSDGVFLPASANRGNTAARFAGSAAGMDYQRAGGGTRSASFPLGRVRGERYRVRIGREDSR